MFKDIEFVQHFAAKLSHDLAGTLGAINSAIEFIDSDDEEVRSKALELMEMSSTQANDKLKFARYAYGVAKHTGDADLVTLKELCTTFGKDGKIKVEFFPLSSVSSEKSIDVNTGKMILCLAYTVKSSLIHGGTLKVSWGNDSKGSIIISGVGNDIKHQVDLHDILSGTNPKELSSSTVHSYYIKRLAEMKSIKIDVNTTANAVSYTIIQG